ncbi:MAG: Holliday junction resolvase RuvX [Dehalococcoidia bacterium]|nr:Holliday junction resolvase RuvX [Dehalococcoidia bacterium]
MRWLGIDPGAARVGIAICDDEERIAVPLEVVPASAAVPAIRAIARREGVGGVVVGLPVTMAGREAAGAAAARKLGERLRRVLELPIEYEDERLTTAAVERLVGRARPSDDLAAAWLLQQFIDRRRPDALD